MLYLYLYKPLLVFFPSVPRFLTPNNIWIFKTALMIYRYFFNDKKSLNSQRLCNFFTEGFGDKDRQMNLLWLFGGNEEAFQNLFFKQISPKLTKISFFF
jgi:hypothetical protein